MKEKNTYRFAKQRDRSSCGPIAVINTLKWMGCKVSQKQCLPLMRKYIGIYGIHYGANVPSMAALLNKFEIQYEIIPHLSGSKKTIKKLIDSNLNQGNSLIVAFRRAAGNGHYVFVYGQKEDKYLIANYNCKTSISEVSKNIFIEKVAYEYYDGFMSLYSYAFVIKQPHPFLMR